MAPQPVEIDFVAGGIAQVLRAFDSLDAKAEQVERSVTGHASTASKTRESGTKKEIDYRAKELQRLVKEAEAREKEMVRDAAKAADQKIKAADAAAKAATKAVEREAKNRQKLAVEEARAEERVWAQSLRERERMAKAATRVEEQAAAERLRIQEREANQAQATERRWSRRYGRAIGTAATGSIGRTLSGAASLVGGALTVGGGFAVAGELREQLKFGEAVVQTANAAFVEGDATRGKRIDPSVIAAMATHVQAGTNINKVDAVNALHKYVNIASDLTGMSEVNKETGRTNFEELARLSKGSGANFEDLMTSAAYLKAQNANLTPTQQNALIRQMVGAGKKGDISLADMAKNSNTATANAGQFAGDFATNQGKMLGLMQIAGRVSDPAEAANAVNKLALDLSANADKKLGPAGIVAKRNGKLVDPADVISALFAKTGGDIGELKSLGIDKRSAKIFEGLQQTFDSAEAIKKGTGAEAVRKEVLDYEHVTSSQKSADTDFNNAMNTDQERVARVLNELGETVAQAALPAFEDFVKTLTEHKDDVEAVIKGLGKLAEALAEHPIASILAAIAANVGKDVAAAGIGKVIEMKIESVLSRTGVPGGGGGGGIGNTVAGAAAVVLPVAMALGTASAASTGEEEGKAQVAGMFQSLAETTAAVKAGKLSPDEGKAKADRIREMLAESKALTGTGAQALDLASVPGSFLPGSVGDAARNNIRTVHREDEVVKNQDALIRALEMLERTIRTGPVAPPGGAARPSRSGPLTVPGAGR